MKKEERQVRSRRRKELAKEMKMIKTGKTKENKVLRKQGKSLRAKLSAETKEHPAFAVIEGIANSAIKKLPNTCKEKFDAAVDEIWDSIKPDVATNQKPSVQHETSDKAKEKSRKEWEKESAKLVSKFDKLSKDGKTALRASLGKMVYANLFQRQTKPVSAKSRKRSLKQGQPVKLKQVAVFATNEDLANGTISKLSKQARKALNAALDGIQCSERNRLIKPDAVTSRKPSIKRERSVKPKKESDFIDLKPKTEESSLISSARPHSNQSPPIIANGPSSPR